MTTEEKPLAGGAETGAIAVPSISLPKGGGAVCGMGEKFAANPVTGTGSLSLPIATSPGRGGFGPQLSLSYDSGSGNGPFGFGWSLSLPAIARKTSKGLPQYADGEESDVFLLSDADDLVPVLEADGSRYEDAVTSPGFVIHRYRPRIEGLFARIERWTRTLGGDVHWRSMSKDNLLTLYGVDGGSRVVDPDEPEHIFSWLVCETRDDKGNAIVYDYKSEDAVDVDLVSIHERNRGPFNSKTRVAARHPKRIRYGNRVSLLDGAGLRPSFVTAAAIETADWMFDVVFDYGEHDANDPHPDDAGNWLCRHDPFSSYRSGFEVRTYRLCQRILMFHQFETEPDVGADCLVRSMEFVYRSVRGDDSDLTRGHPIASFIASVTQRGFRRDPGGGYIAGSLPPLELEYSDAVVHDAVQEIDAESLENMPAGLDGRVYQWVDLDGEGVSGILTEQAGAWFYKPSLGDGRFGPVETVSRQPSLTNLRGGRQQLIDLAGDGQLDLVDFRGPTPGFYERTTDFDWETFRHFSSLPNVAWDDPNLRFVDLDGDGHSDVLITDNDVFTWHPSWAEDGFGPAEQVRQSRDEERGPALVFGDGTQSIYLADMTGDGLTDLVRVRLGEVCYWPNLGYGRFGARITMDNSPWFDQPDQFRQSGVRLADIDGSGTSDLIYIGRDGVRLFFNEAGNSWTAAHLIDRLPIPEDISSVVTVDLLGNGTAALVWSSALPGFTQRTMRYVDLMGGQKPHLLIRVANNFGAETRIGYVSSTHFYLEDKAAGEPWITRLSFPVHVVERVETWDRISRNRFVTHYAYHHGYFDGVEREFRGFGRVEQWDTEQFATLSASDDFPTGDNVDAASHVPPVMTRTWFHTGISLGHDHVSDFFAGFLAPGDPGEYYREPGLTPAQVRALLLDDTPLPTGLTLAEEREACRALKGSMLRQETYAQDGSAAASDPYLVREHNYTVALLQSQGGNRHAVFYVHPREAIEYHYDRDPTDPRISHALTLEVDPFGNVLKSADVGYGRRQPDASLSIEDQARQTTTLVTYTELALAKPIDSAMTYRSPLPSETSTYELTKYPATGSAGRLQASDLVKPGIDGLVHIFDSEIAYEESPGAGRQRRLIECSRILYRPDDFGAAQADPLALLPLGHLESRALAGESYRLAFTPGLLANAYQRPAAVPPPEALIPNATVVLPVDLAGGHIGDRGGYVDLDGDGRWWVPSGRVFHSSSVGDSAAAERAAALQHFFLPCRHRDPFASFAVVTYDAHDLLPLDTSDSLGNRVTAGERNAAGTITATSNDYRVLKPMLVTGPNRNRSAAVFDALGFVSGTAVMGKSEETLGDSVAGFVADLTEAVVLDHLANPLADPHAILGRATSRLVYDLLAFYRTRADPNPQPTVVYTLVRETHDSDLVNPGDPFRIRHSVSYSDGFGREIQKKVQAELGALVDGGPDTDPRWVGDGWTIYNNKGQPVRQYEPFFTATHLFEFARLAGVSPIIFYDPVGRVVVTLRPNQTYEKALFDPWSHESWDANDTIALDPRTDADVSAYVSAWFATQPPAWKTWNAQRVGGALGAREQSAAAQSVAHKNTPTVTVLDTLGREFLTIADNGLDGGGLPQKYSTHIHLDIEGNHREVVDALDRLVMRYDYDMLGHRIHQASMDAGERWMLNDVAEKPIREWDSRGHTTRTEYDSLRRAVRTFVIGADLRAPDQEVLVERRIYGEQHPQSGALNLRGALYAMLDQSGASTTERVDFKGNPLVTTRRLAAEYRTTVAWSTVDAVVPSVATTVFNAATLENGLVQLVEAEVFSGSTEYDALNRPTSVIAPHAAGAAASTVRFTYNLAGLLEQVDANVRADMAAGNPVWTPFVTNIDYDAKGQRTRLAYGNNVVATYTYDPLTTRLVHLLTQRDGVAFPGDSAPTVGWPGKEVQNLSYTYDPVGNITDVRDDAQQTIFFLNQRVEPSSSFTYDPLYRLVAATGREHLGQTAGVPNPPTSPDFSNGFHTRLDHPGDGTAMGTYLEQYVYDTVGNILALQHAGTSPPQAGWSRNYTYGTPSALEPAKMSNRLTSTAVGAAPAEPNTYDAHGSVVGMSHLTIMQCDYRDRLQASSRQVVVAGTPETTWFTYDSAGQRVRKVTVAAAADGQVPIRIKERIYLGGFEIYREFQNDGIGVQLERETLHVLDGPRRIAQVESRTHGNEPGVATRLTRYVLDNHLGSACVELDDGARIISYEEYFPYGSSSYQAVRDALEAPNRYRYTGQERDDETGLYYHGARYFAPWCGRWVSCDPAGPIDGTNVYKYASDNPVKLRDPTGNDPETAKLPTPSLLDTRSPDEKMAARFKGALVPPLRLEPAPDLSALAGWDPLTHALTDPPSPAPNKPDLTPPPAKDPRPSTASDVKGPSFPSSLQVKGGPVTATADTSKVSVGVRAGNTNVTAAYAYGGDVSVTARGPKSAETVSVNPSSGLTTFKVEGTDRDVTRRASVDTSGTFGVGITKGSIIADTSFNPSRQSFAASLSVGGKPAPPPQQLNQIVNNAYTSVGHVVPAIPGTIQKVVSDPSHISDTIAAVKPDINNIAAAGTAGAAIADAPKSPTAVDLRVRFQLTVNPAVVPDTTRGPAGTTLSLGISGTF